MGKTTINAIVTDQELKLSAAPLIVSGGNDENVVKFEFSEHWTDFKKTAVFYRYGGEHYYIPVDENNECIIPWEVLQWQGSFYFGVFGTLGEVIRTSDTVAYNIKQGAFSSGTEIAETSPNIYAEILKRLDAAENGNVSDEQIAEAVDKYLSENPIKAITEHKNLNGRDESEQHPISAITGLQTALNEKQPTGAYLTEETDPTIFEWAKQPTKPSYTSEEVGADSAGTAANAVAAHNINADAHNDIRLLIAALAERLNAIADSDDTTLDQLSEIVTYIQSNRGLIDSITTAKVNVSDIIDNLETNVTNKPLSAAQGVALKTLIDAITVPTKVSELTNDSGYLTEHQDISGKLNISGGTMTGPLIANNTASPTEKQVRNIHVSTSVPTASDGENGDIWLVYA